MRFTASPAALIAAWLLAASPASADVRLTMADGRVSLSATDATIGQILAEWARVGQTRIVNAERLTGAPVTIELKDVPEAQALDVVLRAVSGYLAAPRAATLPDASRFDRIYVLPTSTAAPARVTAAAPPAVFQSPPAQPDDQDSDDAPPARPPAPPVRGAAFNTFPQPRPEPEEPEQPAQAAPVIYQPSNAPVGVAAPGMMVPATPPPGQARPGR